MTCTRCGHDPDRGWNEYLELVCAANKADRERESAEAAEESLQERVDELEEALRRIAYPDVNGDQLNHDSCINVARLALEDS